jgi:predicted ATPase
LLDNLEQLPELGRDVAHLLQGTTALRVLATSREPLRVAGEHAYPVDPLPVPAADERDPRRLATTPSVALLLDRARSRSRWPELGDTEEAALRDVVRSLDGLPLALEIVAPWLGALGPRGLLGEIDRALDLTSRVAEPDERHRTIRSAIAWSHDRLTPPEQRLLRRMSVLRGGGDLDAVRAVAGEDLGGLVPDVLVDLLERNVVQRAEPVDGSPRFRLLETVRQFAGERLAEAGEQATTELRAADHFASWAVGLAAHSAGSDADRWLTRALADADNLRAAMDALARAGQAADHLQLVVDSWALWVDVGYEAEGEGRLRAALDAAPDEHPARAVGLVCLATIAGLHDRDREREMIEAAVTLARASGDEPVLAFALVAMSDVGISEEEARQRAADAAAIAERIRGRPVRYSWLSPDALAGAAAEIMANYFMHRDVPAAIRWQRLAAECTERGRNPRALASILGTLAWMHLLGGEVESAGQLAERARLLVGDVGEGRWTDVVALVAARVLHCRGNLEASAAAFRQLIDAGLATGRLPYVCAGSFFLVDVLVDQHDVPAADAVLTRIAELLPDTDDHDFLGHLQARRARLLRLMGRPGDAESMLAAMENGIEPDALRPEHMIWLVEHVMLSDEPDEARTWLGRLEDLSRRTGVAIPQWERRLLAGLTRPR